jgi:cell division protein FtsZ
MPLGRISFQEDEPEDAGGTSAPRTSQPLIEEPSPAGPIVKIFGIGTGGIEYLSGFAGSPVRGAELIAIDSNWGHLSSLEALGTLCIEIPQMEAISRDQALAVAEDAALRQVGAILDFVRGADLVIILSGLGGVTGTAVAPVVAALAQETGALTVAIVTSPFAFEGRLRAERASYGLARLAKVTDTLIEIPLEDAGPHHQNGVLSSVARRFSMDAISKAVAALVRPLIEPHSALLAVDLADMKMLFHDGGTGALAVGSATGDSAGLSALVAALGEDGTLVGGRALRDAARVWLRVAGGNDLTLYDVAQIMNVVHTLIHPEALSCVSVSTEEEMSESVRITILASGFDRLPRLESRRGRSLYEAIETVIARTGDQPDELGLPSQSSDNRAAAEQRAEAMLGQLLPEQARTYQQEGYIEIESALHEGRCYRIHRGPGVFLTTVIADGEVIGEASATLRGEAFPATDRVLAEYLLIRGDEQHYLKTANIKWKDQPDDAESLGESDMGHPGTQ